MKNKLFVYGTLRDPYIQIKAFGRPVAGIPDSLSGYARSEIKIEDEMYPLIVPSEGSRVDGVVLDLTDEELELVDNYESDAYKRAEVRLDSGAMAWAYVKNLKNGL